ncbi:DNA translocase FtsK [Roseibacillus ishigakijimensis]|uniref:DNA translocase FtsK n=1 Tax=Roseibacillus ishigakijimensis TaxID=454146 RepID=A0A934VNS3_9BACT|nr:DNA translocase FtsK [Roseibacillus ishigakijimensis]MBK1835366.1 DNA translocase FtsK [Roseibacillus ishigakijimensis]
MARPKNRAKRKRSNDDRVSRNLWGFGLIALGVLLLFSLLSYHPSDLASIGVREWRPFAKWSDGVDDGHVKNLIGPLGAMLGWVQLQFFGAAAWFIPFSLGWLGFRRLRLEGEIGWKTWTSFPVFLISAACLAGVLAWWDRWAAVNVVAAKSGGIMGYYLGEKVFHELLSTAGSVLVLGFVYLASLIFFLGLHPISFSKELYGQVLALWEAKREAGWSAPTKPRSSRKSSPAPRKKAPRKPHPEEEEEWQEGEEMVTPEVKVEESGQATLPLREVPEPKIVDGAQRRGPDANLARPFERKKKEHASLSTDGFEDYELPGFDLLDYDSDNADPVESNHDELYATQKTIIDTLRAFNVEVTPGDITRGPTITRYEIYPSLGLRVSRITQLESDLARATCAESINILAPVPGKDTVGIEIANDDRVPVALRELLQDPEFRSSKKKIPLALGKDVYGNAVIGDLAAMPHLLVAGATGSGKSVCINSIITSILYKFSPDELRFIMVDPKVVEMQMYNQLPHLVVPVVTDPRKVIGALKWTVNEMERRYKIFAKLGVRNFDSFNSRPRPEVEKATDEMELAQEAEAEEPEEEPLDPEHLESIAKALEDGELGPMDLDGEDDDERVDEDEIPDRFPYIVVIVDELADLMQTAPADVESAIARIAQKARAAGIHLIIATQTPRADVVTGIIKANIPSRIAFQVSSALDSRVILDSKGAEKLVGKGDMLFLPPGSAKLERSQGAFVSDEEVEHIIEFCSNQTEQQFEQSIQDTINAGGASDDGAEEVSDEDEEIIAKCIDVIMTENKASTSLLQRRLRLGYTKAARMMDILEARGIIGPADGAKPRDILVRQ